MSALVNPTANHATRIFEGNTIIRGNLTAQNVFTDNEWKAYTPTLVSGGTFATSATITGRFRLTGRTLHFQFRYVDTATTGAATSGAYLVALPAGVILSSSTALMPVGSAFGISATPKTYTGTAYASGTTSPGFLVLLGNEASTPAQWGNASPAADMSLTAAGGVTVAVSGQVEIAANSPILLVQNK
jgi:hypothetical protein